MGYQRRVHGEYKFAQKISRMNNGGPSKKRPMNDHNAVHQADAGALFGDGNDANDAGYVDVPIEIDEASEDNELNDDPDDVQPASDDNMEGEDLDEQVD